MSDFVTGYWYIVIAVIAAIVIAIKLYKQTDSGQMFFGNLARKIPVFGKLNIKTAASNYARTLSTLVYSGLPMIEALGITADTMKNALYKKALKNAREEVSKGVPLSEPITACGLFPPMVSHMTRSVRKPVTWKACLPDWQTTMMRKLSWLPRQLWQLLSL